MYTINHLIYLPSVTPEQHKATIIQYIYSCMDREDWHGVSDAANDLRVLDARYPQLRINI